MNALAGDSGDVAAIDAEEANQEEMGNRCENQETKRQREARVHRKGLSRPAFDNTTLYFSLGFI